MLSYTGGIFFRIDLDVAEMKMFTLDCTIYVAFTQRDLKYLNVAYVPFRI